MYLSPKTNKKPRTKAQLESRKRRLLKPEPEDGEDDI